MEKEPKKYLIQRFTSKGYGRIWDYTEQLAARADMLPWEGEVPASRIVTIVGGAVVQEPRQAPYKMDFETGAVVTPDSTASVTPTETATGIPESPSEAAQITEDEWVPDLDKVEAPTPVVPAMTPEAKQAKLVEILTDPKQFPNDNDHFTASGVPRIDALCMALGADVQSKERNAAWEAVQKIKK